MKITNYCYNTHQKIFEKIKVTSIEISNNISEIIKRIPSYGISFKKFLGSIVALGATKAYAGPMALVAATTTFVAHRIFTPIFTFKSNTVENYSISNPEISYYENLSQNQVKEEPSTTHKQQEPEIFQKKTVNLTDKALKFNQEQQIYEPALLSSVKRTGPFQNNILVLRNKNKKNNTEQPKKKISKTEVIPNLDTQEKKEIKLKEKATAIFAMVAVAYFTKNNTRILNLFLKKGPFNTNKLITQTSNKLPDPTNLQNALLIPHQAPETQITLKRAALEAQKAVTSPRYKNKKIKTKDSKIHLIIQKVLHKKTPITIATKKRVIKNLSQCPSNPLSNQVIKIISAHRSNRTILKNLRNYYLNQTTLEILNSSKNDQIKIRRIRAELKKQPRSDLKKELKELISQKNSQEQLIQLIKNKISSI